MQRLLYSESVKTGKPSVAKNYDSLSADLVTGGGTIRSPLIDTKNQISPDNILVTYISERKI